MMKTNLSLIFLLVFAAVFSFACGGNNTNQTTNTAVNNTNTAHNAAVSNTNKTNSNVAVVQDNFWTKAAQGGMAEVELGKLALQKSQNPDVKKFAQTIVTDHTKANDELKTLAAKKSVLLPTDIGSHKSTIDDLSKLFGADFDKEYVKTMVEDHEEDVDLFEDNSTNSDADIKGFASKHLPTLKLHLVMIKNIQNKMK